MNDDSLLLGFQDFRIQREHPVFRSKIASLETDDVDLTRDPVLLAVRAASMATLPPPITITFLPSDIFSPELIRLR